MLWISVLGPVAVSDGDEPLRIPSGKTSELLVRLALEPGSAIRADRLVEDLWGPDAAATRPNTLQSKVAMLRRALRDPAAVVSVDGGYRLDVDPCRVDVCSVIETAAAARGRLDEGEVHQVVEECASALRRFSGDLVPGAGDAPWVAPHRARLAAVRVQLVETWGAARLRAGEASEVVADLEVAVADHPFQEGLWALLVTALYRAGRQADALAAYQRVRDALRDELGLDPGPELAELERQILAHDDRLGTAGPPVPLDARSSGGNLPSLALALVGRDRETASLVDSVRRHRLVELVGPGGVGKTALAVAVGRLVTMPGGVWLVRLEGATNAAEVVDATVAALGVTGGEHALIERLRITPSMLVIDNCEHVLDAAAAWVLRLLDAAPDGRVLCTSQAPLDIDGSTVVDLEPLDVDDAVTLFVERATIQRHVSSTPDRDAAVRALCHALDGLPLAIELAAARTRTLSVDEITRRLDDRFVVLSDPTSRRPERRRALRATIAWSYDLLFPDDQRGLWALATFAGGAPLAAVEVVLGALGVPAPATIDIIGRLGVRSLLIVEESEAGARYRLLDSIRDFALESMGDAEVATARTAHARWFAAAARASTEGVRSARQAEHLAFVRDERANIDAALTWAGAHDPSLALAIATGFGWAWVVLGDSRGAERVVDALDVAGDGAAPGQRADALLLAGWIEASTGDLEPARRHVLDAEGIADVTGDVELQARAAYHLAYVVSHHGDFRDAIALTERSRELYSDLDRPWDLAANGLFAARAAISGGDEARALRAADDVERLLRVVDDPWLHVRKEAMLGELARLQHRFDAAVEHIGRAVETSHRLGFRQTEAYQVASLGRAQCQTGDVQAGAATLTRAVEMAEAIGDVRMAALARVHLGRVLRTFGRTDEARRTLQHTVDWHRRAGGGEQALLGECLLAAIDSAAAAPGAAHLMEDILARAAERDDAPVEVFALDALALVAARAGHRRDASVLLSRADQRMVAASHFVSERDRVDARAAREAFR